MRVRIRSIGRLDPIWQEAAEHYRRRLLPYLEVEWVVLPEERVPATERPRREGLRLLRGVVPADAFLLDQAGQEWSSEELAARVGSVLDAGRCPVFLIGGAYGVDEETRRQVRHLWSLSRLTFPHQLVPVLLLEQLYRVMKIRRGEPYHH
jgi:23S rRNA (pseudouridine1915-N3)-methyltransferase